MEVAEVVAAFLLIVFAHTVVVGMTDYRSLKLKMTKQHHLLPLAYPGNTSSSL